MSEASAKAFAYIEGVEGELSMDPNDKGNWTGGRVGVGQLRGSKYGMSAAEYPTLDIANLTLATVQGMFDTNYWEKVRGDDLPFPIALCVADDAYNHGPEKAIHTLQAALGVKVDGELGPATIDAAQHANVRAAVLKIQTYRGLEYASDPNEARYGFGWFHDRVLGTTLAALEITSKAA